MRGDHKGTSLSYGFMRFASDAIARRVIEEKNGVAIQGRNLRCLLFFFSTIHFITLMIIESRRLNWACHRATTAREVQPTNPQTLEVHVSFRQISLEQFQVF